MSGRRLQVTGQNGDVGAKTTYYFVYLVDLVCLVYLFDFTNYIHFINLVCHAHICHGSL